MFGCFTIYLLALSIITIIDFAVIASIGTAMIFGESRTTLTAKLLAARISMSLYA